MEEKVKADSFISKLVRSSLSPVITNPLKFVHVLESLPTSTESLISCLNSLVQLISQCIHNGPLVNYANQSDNPLKKEADVICSLVDLAFRYPALTDSKDKNPILLLLKSLLRNWTAKRHHYECVCQHLSTICSIKPDTKGILLGLKIIRILSKCNFDIDVFSYFFFSPFRSSLSVTFKRNFQWPFAQGFTVIYWLRLENLDSLKDCTNSFLLRILDSKKQGLELILERQQLLCKTKSNELVLLQTIKPDCWHFLAISYASNDKIQILLDFEIRQLVCKYQTLGKDEEIKKFELCENIAGQICTVAMFSAPLSQANLKQIKEKFPKGFSDYSHFADAANFPQEKLLFLFSPAKTSSGSYFIQNLCKNTNNEISAELKGNAGMVRLPSISMKTKYLLPISNILPLMQFTNEGILLENLMKTIKILMTNLQIFEDGNIRAIKEYRTLSTMFEFNISKFSPSIAHVSIMQTFEEIVSKHQKLAQVIISMLFNTRNFWIRTEHEVQKRYWKLLVMNYKCISKKYEEILTDLIASLAFHNNDSCDESLTEFISAIMENIQSVSRNYSVRCILSVTLKKEAKIPQCIFLTLIKALTNAIKSKFECEETISALHGQIMERSSEYDSNVQVACAELLSLAMQKPNDTEIKKYMWYNAFKSTAKIVTQENPKPDVFKKSLPNDQDDKDDKDEEKDEEELLLENLEKKVFEEGEKVNQAIKKIQEIKDDIHSTRQTTEKPVTSEIATAIIPGTTPPPAPRHEQQKKKTFGFGSSGGRSLASSRSNSEDTARMEARKKEQKKSNIASNKTKGKFVPPKLKMIAIDTEAVNKEFDFGGERGKKIIDEAEEESKWENEVFELAEHCVNAMKRSSSLDPVRPSYLATQNIELPTIKDCKEETKEQSQIRKDDIIVKIGESKDNSQLLLEKLMKLLIGGEENEMKDLRVENSGILAPIILLLKKHINTSFFDTIVTKLLELAESSEENRVEMVNNEKFMSNLMKMHLGVNSEKAISLVNLTKLHTKLILQKLMKNSFPYTIVKHLVVEPINKNAADCVRQLWGNLLEEVKLKIIERKDLIPFITETTFALIVYMNEPDSAKGLKLKSISTTLFSAYSDLEIFDMLFNTLAESLWDDPKIQKCLQDPLNLAEFMLTNAKYIEQNHIEIFTKETIKNSKLPRCISAISILLCYILGFIEGLSHVEHWLQIAEHVIRYFLVLSEFKKIDKAYFDGSILLLLGFIIKKSASQDSLPESAMMFRKFAASILMLVLRMTQMHSGQVKDFYKKQLVSVHGRYLIPMDEIAQFLKEKKEEDLEALLAENANSMLGSNLQIAKELEKLDKNYVESLKRDAKNTVKIEKLKRKEIKDKIISTIKSKEQDVLKAISQYEKEAEINISKMNTELYIRENRRVNKWYKVLSEVKQWQGLWRNKEIFSELNGKNIPMKLSSHRFANGLKCMLKLRSKRQAFHSTALNKYHKEDVPDTFFELLTDITVSKNKNEEIIQEPREDIALMLYNRIDKKIKDKIPEPINVEIYGSLYAKSGKILIYQSQSRETYLVFVRKKYKKTEGTEAGDETEDIRLMYKRKRNENGKIIKKWKLSDIKMMLKKQIVENKAGLEITFYNGVCLLLNFETEDKRDILSSKLVRLREKWCKGLQYPGTLDPIRAFEKNKLTEQWESRKISTLDYLLALNIYSSRSFDNLSQYPVFPWILGESQDENSLSYRDLSKNMGMVGDPERAEEYKKKYVQEDLSGFGRFHFGSNYSNPGIVLQYTMRLYPFFEAYVKFFSGLDDPNRMFYSILDSYQSATKDISDVREVIPEFYSLPEIFLNKERIALGKRTEKQESEKTVEMEVDNVVLSKQANNSAYQYVIYLRELLESEAINASNAGICGWIDLLFGYKQRGKAAEKAFNVFPPLSYEPGKILSTVKSEKKLHEAYKMQAYHWGQIPQQIVQHKHKERTERLADQALWDQDTSCSWQICKEQISNKRIIKIAKVNHDEDDTKFIAIGIDGSLQKGNISHSGSQINLFSITERYDNNYSVGNSFVTRLDSMQFAVFPILILTTRKLQYIAQGGYWDGAIQLTPLSEAKRSTLTLYYHTSTVTCLETDTYERFVIVGTKEGDCAIYSIEEDMFWKPQSVLVNHSSEVTCIHLSEGMQLFATSSTDGSVNLYNCDIQPKLMRTFRHKDDLPVHNVALAQSPLPCVILFSKTDFRFICYSINGELLSEMQEMETKIISPIIVHDSNFCDYLVYVREKDGSIIQRKTPTLEAKVMEGESERVSTSCELIKQKYFVVGTEDGIISLLLNNDLKS